MKVLVAAKRVVDPNVRIRLRSDGRGFDAAGLKTCINPFDEVAIEQAVRLKEAGLAKEVVLVTIGLPAAKDTLREGLALGADRGILIESMQSDLEPLAVASLLAAVVNKESPSLVLLGKQSVDNDAAQCGPMLAGLLNWPQATFVAQIKAMHEAAEVSCDTEAGNDQLSVPLPCVLTADLRLAEPRYATLPNVMAARRKPIETLKASDLVPQSLLEPHLELLKVEMVDTRRQIQMAQDAEDLAQRLKELTA